MPEGKPANVRCVQLAADESCRLFGHPKRPKVCESLKPHPDLCGSSREEASLLIQILEKRTRPA
jgi:hypothetical protein